MNGPGSRLKSAWARIAGTINGGSLPVLRVNTRNPRNEPTIWQDWWIGSQAEVDVQPGASDAPEFSGVHPFGGRTRTPAHVVEFGVDVFGASQVMSALRGRGVLLRSAVLTGGSESGSALHGGARIGGELSGGSRMSSRLEPWERPNVDEENELLVALLLESIQ